MASKTRPLMALRFAASIPVAGEARSYGPRFSREMQEKLRKPLELQLPDVATSGLGAGWGEPSHWPSGIRSEGNGWSSLASPNDRYVNLPRRGRRRSGSLP